MPKLIRVVKVLLAERASLAEEIKRLDAAIAALNENSLPRRPQKTRSSPKPAKKSRGMSTAQRKAVSMRMKAYWKARKVAGKKQRNKKR